MPFEWVMSFSHVQEEKEELPEKYNACPNNRPCYSALNAAALPHL